MLGTSSSFFADIFNHECKREKKNGKNGEKKEKGCQKNVVHFLTSSNTKQWSAFCNGAPPQQMTHLSFFFLLAGAWAARASLLSLTFAFTVSAAGLLSATITSTASNSSSTPSPVLADVSK